MPEGNGTIIYRRGNRREGTLKNGLWDGSATDFHTTGAVHKLNFANGFVTVTGESSIFDGKTVWPISYDPASGDPTYTMIEEIIKTQ